MISGTRLALRRRVLVNLKTGRALRGVLWARAGRYVVLKDVELFEPGRTQAQAVTGEVVVEESNVDFVQVLADREG